MKTMCVTSVIFVVFLGVLGFAQEKVLQWNLGVDPATIDPSYATGVAAQQIDHALFLGLTDIDDETLTVIPRLATIWEVSDDGISWTFHLRRDAIWSDGTPVTAHDIVFAIERTLDPNGSVDPGRSSDPESSSPLVQKLYVRKGAQAYHTGTGRARDIGARAIDNHTVRFTLNKPDDCFPALVSEPVFYPQPRSIVEDYGIDWTKPEPIVTDGPYTLGQWVSDRIVLYKSTTYYDEDKGNIDEIYCYMIADEAMALDMYKEGKLDVVSVSWKDVQQVKANSSLSKQLHIYPSEAPSSGPSCLPAAAYPAAQLTKNHVVRTYAIPGREKWESWDIR